MNDTGSSVPDVPMPSGRLAARHALLLHQMRADLATPSHSRFSRVPRTLVVVTPLIVAAAAISGVLVASRLWSSNQGVSVLASWTPSPTPVSSGEARTVDAKCHADLQSAGWPMQVSSMQGILAEQRGELTAVMLGGGGQAGMCIFDANMNEVFMGVDALGSFSSGTGAVLDGDPGQLSDPGAFRIAYGQIAPDVATVTIDTADGYSVSSTISDGLFFAWWPSGADPTTVTAATSEGAIVAVLHPAATSPLIPTPTAPLEP